MAYRCQHVSCRTEVQGQRHAYKAANACDKHERKRFDHPCSEAAGCATCKRWAGKRVGKIAKAEVWRCRHGGCSRFYSGSGGRRAHELETHSCLSSCERCGQIQSKQKRKRDQELREEAEARLANERKRQRIEHTIARVEQITSFPWQELAEDHLDCPEEELIHAQVCKVLTTTCA